MSRIRVGVIDDHEIFRRGLIACLHDDPQLTVVELNKSMPAPDTVDVIVASSNEIVRRVLPCPAVVCCSTEGETALLHGRDDVLAVLQRRTVTPGQVVAAVHAAAVGLQVNCESRADHDVADRSISDRSREVLRLLAGGAGTREISRKLGYSERTIKASIYEVQVALGTRNRAHAVAEAVRANLI